MGKYFSCLLAFLGLFLFGDYPDVELNVYLNGSPIGTHRFQKDANEGVIIQKEDEFLNLVSPHLNEKGNSRIKNLIQENNFIIYENEDEDQFDKEPIFFYYIPDNGFYLNVDKEYLSPIEANISSVSVVQPAPFSGYLNMSYGHKIFHKKPAAFPLARHGDYANFDLNLNYEGAVLQGFAYLHSEDKRLIDRGNLIFTKDFHSHFLRFSAGDIGNFSFGFQNAIPMLGFSFSRGESVFINPIIASASRNEFFLNIPSRVDVFVDGILYQTEELSSGPHLLQNFPLIQGLNNVSLRITAPTGDVQRIELNKFFNPTLLPAGHLEWFVAGGFPSFDEKRNAYHYQFDRPTVSISTRYGYSDEWTVGGYLQGNTTGGFSGVQSINYYGFLKTILDAGFSFPKVGPISNKLRLALSTKGSFWKMESSWERMDPGFSYLEMPVVRNPISQSVSAKMQLGLPYDIKTAATGLYQWKRDGKPDTFRLELRGEKNFFKSFVSRFILGFDGKVNQKGRYTFACSLDYIPEDSDWKLRSSYSHVEKFCGVALDYRKLLEADREFEASAGATRALTSTTGTGKVRYKGSRWTAGVDEYAALGYFPVVSEIGRLIVSQMNVATSIAFIGSQFAFCRPIEDSFAFVTQSDSSLRAYIGEDKSRYQESWRGMPAVISNLKGYQRYVVQVEGEKGNTSISVIPSYRSGTLVEVH